MNLSQWFEKGLTADQYIKGMKVNQSEMRGISERFSLSNQEKEQLSILKQKGLNVIVLTEDWCGDALLNNPILLAIASEIGIEVRFLLRDQNLELMDQYLTNGTSRAIPIFIFFNQQGEEQAVWGPRAKRIQEIVDYERSKLPPEDDPHFKDMQKAMYKKLVASYQVEETLWHAVTESMIETLCSLNK